MNVLLKIKWAVPNLKIAEQAFDFFSTISYIRYVRYYSLDEKIRLNPSFFNTVDWIEAEHSYVIELGVLPDDEFKVNDLFSNHGKEITEDPFRVAFVLEKSFLDLTIIKPID